MIHHLNDVRGGYEVEGDVIVIGSGAGGAVAAENLARAGMRVILLEAGPELRQEDMTRDAPRFMARYYWDGGLRLAGGSMPIPVMQGRCLGGSTVVNSAIMYKLPDWVRQEWVAEDGLDELSTEAFDRAFDRVFQKTRTAPTPMTVMGRRNLIVGEALAKVGVRSNPLPRAVEGCEGCGDCLTGCHEGHKQSVDKCYVPDALAHGAEVFTCSEVDRIIFSGARSVGVSGRVVDPIQGFRNVGRFVARAPRIVLAAGAVNTPVLLHRSGVKGNRIGDHLAIHLTGGCFGVMDEIVEPWLGATQGWGAISEDIRGLKYESLWAPPSIFLVRWGDVGLPFLEMLSDVKHVATIVMVYRGKVQGRVKARFDGAPDVKIYIPDDEMRVLMRGLERAVRGLLAAGARRVHTGIHGIKDPIETAEEAAVLLTQQIRAQDTSMTGNHIFGSCRMSVDPNRGPVDAQGRLRGVEGVWVADASLFPSPSAVNPQATIMALSELISRRMGELKAD